MVELIVDIYEYCALIPFSSDKHFTLKKSSDKQISILAQVDRCAGQGQPGICPKLSCPGSHNNRGYLHDDKISNIQYHIVYTFVLLDLLYRKKRLLQNLDLEHDNCRFVISMVILLKQTPQNSRHKDEHLQQHYLCASLISSLALFYRVQLTIPSREKRKYISSIENPLLNWFRLMKTKHLAYSKLNSSTKTTGKWTIKT